MSFSHLLFPLFLGLAIAWGAFTGLYRKSGVRLRSRVGYGVLLSTGFAFFFLLAPTLRPSNLTASFVLGAALTPSFLFYSHRRLRNGIQGNVMRYPRQSRWLYLATVVLITFLLHFVLQPDQVRQYSWLVLGLLFAWWSSSIFEFMHVLRMESRLGTPITEQYEV
jgi:hypothetical protein